MRPCKYEIVLHNPTKFFHDYSQKSFFWESKYQKQPNNEIIIKGLRKKLNGIGLIIFCGGWFAKMVLSDEIRVTSWPGHGCPAHVRHTISDVISLPVRQEL